MSRPVLTTSGLYTLFGFVTGEMQAPEAKSFLGGADRQVPAASGEGPPRRRRRSRGELIELRNTTCLFFFLINSLFVVLVLTLQYVAQDSSNLSIKVTLLPLAFSLRVRILLFCDDDRGTVKYETRDV